MMGDSVGDRMRGTCAVDVLVQILKYDSENGVYEQMVGNGKENRVEILS